MKAYRVRGWRGIAFVKVGRPKGYRVKVRMIGDDRVFEVNKDDCEPLKKSEFCSECGQIGCTCSARR